MFLFLLFVQAGICAAVLSGFPKHEPGPGATQGSARVSVICEAARSSHHRQCTPACSLPRLGPGSCQAATWFRMRQLLQPRRDAIREAHWLLAVSPLCRENGAVVMLGFLFCDLLHAGSNKISFGHMKATRGRMLLHFSPVHLPACMSLVKIHGACSARWAASWESRCMEAVHADSFARCWRCPDS